MVGTKLSHYTIDAEIGRGGMGIVYKATDTKLDRTVALKLLPSTALTNQDDRTRFYREAKAAAQLHHPHIASIFEIDEAIPEGSSSDDLRPFIAMEFIDGQPLETRIKEGPMVIEEAIRIATEIAEALKEAHEKGIVHRDIKSANVMLDKNARAKVLDFGLAKTAQSTMLTRMGSTMGTIAYMSPEQARGNEVDHRTDLWALGVVIYEMITGTLPFGGDYEQAIVYSIMNEEPKPLTALRTGVPMDLEWITNKLFAKEASSRYNSAADLIVDLKNVVHRPSRVSSISASAHHTLAQEPEKKTTFPSWMAYALGALLLTGGFIAGSLTGSPPAPESQDSFRFTLTFPEVREAGYPDFSPDGQYVVFNGVDTSSGMIGLFRRDLRAGETLKIADLDEMSAVEYSPDGETLAVASTTSLYLYSPSGQLLSTLDGAANSDIEWSSNNSILIDPQNGVIRELYLNGDPSSVVASPDTLKGERFYWWPKLLPDSRYVLYTAIMDAADQESEIRVVDRDTGESTLVISGGLHAKYAPSGHLIYSLWDSDQIVAQPFDLATLSMTGPKVNLFNANMHSVLYHPNHWIIYQPEPQEESFRAWKLNDPDNAPFTLTSTSSTIPGVSGKGTVVTVRDVGENSMEMLISDPYTSYEEVLIQEPLIEEPTFSASEDQIAYVTDRNGEEYIEIISVSDPTQRRSFPMGNRESIAINDWTPDANFLLISSSSFESDAQRFGLLDLNTSEFTPFLDQRLEALNGQFSPDGQRVAYTHIVNGNAQVSVSPRNGIGRLSLDGDFFILESWTTDSKALLLNDYNENRLLQQSLSASGRVSVFGEPTLLYESEYFYSGHMLDSREILIFESEEDPDMYHNFSVITGADQFLKSIAPPR
jgi:serine/threonine protein kinase